MGRRLARSGSSDQGHFAHSAVPLLADDGAQAAFVERMAHAQGPFEAIAVAAGIGRALARRFGTSRIDRHAMEHDSVDMVALLIRAHLDGTAGVNSRVADFVGAAVLATLDDRAQVRGYAPAGPTAPRVGLRHATRCALGEFAAAFVEVGQVLGTARAELLDLARPVVALCSTRVDSPPLAHRLFAARAARRCGRGAGPNLAPTTIVDERAVRVGGALAGRCVAPVEPLSSVRSSVGFVDGLNDSTVVEVAAGRKEATAASMEYRNRAKEVMTNSVAPGRFGGKPQGFPR